MPAFNAHLVPFDPQHTPDIEIGCLGKTVANQELDIHFTLAGDIEQLTFDPPVTDNKRTDNLWQTTCFELFVKNETSTNYWEYNLSPSTNWAIYRFSGYREGKFDELSINEIPIQIIRETSKFTLECRIALPAPLFEQNLKIGLSTVVQDNNGVIYYYALKHTKNQADFHDADSFIIDITVE